MIRSAQMRSGSFKNGNILNIQQVESECVFQKLKNCIQVTLMSFFFLDRPYLTSSPSSVCHVSRPLSKGPSFFEKKSKK